MKNPTILLGVITALTAIISVVISICTLRQNSKMIESTSRPYIAIEVAHVANSYYLKLRNYGNSMAIIDGIEINENVQDLLIGPSKAFFKQIEGLSMPPAYTLMNCIHGDEIKGKDNQLLKFKIKYHSSTGKKYVEQQELDFRFYRIAMEARRSITDKNASEMIAKSLQDLVITTETK